MKLKSILDRTVNAVRAAKMAKVIPQATQIIMPMSAQFTCPRAWSKIVKIQRPCASTTYKVNVTTERTFQNLCRALQPLLLVHGADGADQPRLEEGEGSEQVCVERVGILVAVQRDQDDEGRAKRAVKREHARANDERAHGVVVPAHSQKISPRRKRQASFL